jgi:hypothetical protein
MATQWPVVHARLVALLPTLAGWPQFVYDGPPVTGDVPTSYATVGYVLNEVSAGSFSQTRSGDGFRVEETGGIRCELVTSTGDTDLATVRAQAFALMDVLEQAIRADQTLGVMAPASTAALTVDVVPSQSTAGAVQRLPFTLDYFTVT